MTCTNSWSSSFLEKLVCKPSISECPTQTYSGAKGASKLSTMRFSPIATRGLLAFSVGLLLTLAAEPVYASAELSSKPQALWFGLVAARRWGGDEPLDEGEGGVGDLPPSIVDRQ